MKSIIKYFFVIFTITSFISCGRCKDCVEEVTFMNNSQETLVIKYLDKYPDSSFNRLTSCDCDAILPHTKCECKNRLGWNNINNTIMFILWNKDTVDKYGFENCKTEDKLLKKYKLSEEELENMGWTIAYP